MSFLVNFENDFSDRIEREKNMTLLITSGYTRGQAEEIINNKEMKRIKYL